MLDREVDVRMMKSFRAPHWSAGLLHLHFSVARGFVLGEDKITMPEEKLPIAQQRAYRVSSAVWPVNVRRGVSLGKTSQRHRDWIIQGQWGGVLVDALSRRMLFVWATLLVVASSLLVALLGLRFWYLLLLPLLLFALLLILPSFLTKRTVLQMPPPPFSAFSHDFRSSMGLLSLSPQALKSSPDLFSAETPSTPMPVDQPLVRVLETVDLRKMPIEHFLKEGERSETAEYARLLLHKRDFQFSTLRTQPLQLDERASDV
jgi:hypothetical protein